LEEDVRVRYVGVVREAQDRLVLVCPCCDWEKIFCKKVARLQNCKTQRALEEIFFYISLSVVVEGLA
jgi:hypothetical protein